MIVLTFLAPFLGIFAFLLVLFLAFGPGYEIGTDRKDIPYSDDEKLLAQQYREETSFVSSLRENCQFVKIFRRKWFPKREPRAIVIFAHGLNEHSGRAVPIIRNLLNHEFAVYAKDHEGFGRSDGRHGFFADFNHLVDDLLQLVETAKKDFPGKKIFLHGGSMGGLMVIHVALRSKQGDLAGAVIQCPAIEIHKESRPPPIVEKAARFLAAVAPKIPFAEANRGKNNSPSVLAKVEAEINADPLFYTGRLRIGTGLGMLKAIEEAQSKLADFSLPYLLQHGTKDRVCSLKGSKDFHQVNASQDKTFIEYPDGAHDLPREPKEISASVEKDYLEWLKSRSS